MKTLRSRLSLIILSLSMSAPVAWADGLVEAEVIIDQNVALGPVTGDTMVCKSSAEGTSCYARDAKGETLECVTKADLLGDAKGDYLVFEVDDSGECVAGMLSNMRDGKYVPDTIRDGGYWPDTI